MINLRSHLAGIAATLAAVLALATLAAAQNYGPPMMSANVWTTVENAGGQTWDGVWTFDNSHRTMSGSWVNRTTGEHVYDQRMTVRQSGQQLIITRQHLGNYVGTLASDGRSISGTMSWSTGNFTARMSNGNGQSYGPRNDGYGPPQGGYSPPMMSAATWSTVENAGGQTWDGYWVFENGHRTMNGSWVNRQTGERVYANNMTVRQAGQQLIITRRGLGNYVGTLAADGRSIRGTMSWSTGNFTARM